VELEIKLSPLVLKGIGLVTSTIVWKNDTIKIITKLEPAESLATQTGQDHETHDPSPSAGSDELR